MSTLRNLGLLAASIGVAGSSAFADGREPGSLLVFPEFDNSRGVATVLTVTNTNRDHSNGDIDVEFVYWQAKDLDGKHQACTEFNRVESLTPNDTLSLVTRSHNPGQGQGWATAFAIDPWTGECVVFNHLIGHLLVVDGLSQFEYSVNPFVFRGIGDGPGTATDIDGDGVKDLDGLEYERAPDKIYVPRFIGQTEQDGDQDWSQDGAPPQPRFAGELILLDLTGTQFETSIDFLVYNDNEEVFSEQHSFKCWHKLPLLEVGNVFSQAFLEQVVQQSNYGNHHDESLQGNLTGWFCMDGGIANSYARSVVDPAFLAVYIERVGNYAAADLPFERGSQDNGGILSLGQDGNN